MDFNLHVNKVNINIINIINIIIIIIIMATRKLFHATKLYLTTDDSANTHAHDRNDTQKNARIDLRDMFTVNAQKKEKKEKKIAQVNKTFMNNTIMNTVQSNLYHDTNRMYRAKKRIDELDFEHFVSSEKTPVTLGKRKKSERESSGSSKDADADDDTTNNDTNSSMIKNLILLSKTKRGRGLTGMRCDDVVTTPKTSEIMKRALESLDRKAKRNKKKKRRNAADADGDDKKKKKKKGKRKSKVKKKKSNSSSGSGSDSGSGSSSISSNK